MKNLWVMLPVLLLIIGCSEDNILSYEDQLKKDKAAIDKYLDKNGIVAIKDTSGLRIVVHTPGTGLFPVASSRMTVKYKGKFLNGVVFDQNDETSSGLPVPLSGTLADLIPGWQIAFGKYIAKGGKATFFVPSGLGYGRNSSGGVPGNSNLMFEVELIGFVNGI